MRIASAIALPPSLALCGVLMAISVGAPGNEWLAWIGLIPLLAASRAYSPLKAGLAGAVWGLCFYSSAVAGVAPSISTGPLSLTLLALVPAAYTALGSLATRAVGFVPLMMALLWILAEVALRPLGLQSGLLASTQGEGNFASWIAGLLGYVFVASAIVYANAWLLNLAGRIRLPVPAIRRLGTALGQPRALAFVPALAPASPSVRPGYPRGPPSI
ncbi:MAG: hypothetical protein AABZ08_11150 [Planctomycetota bacterium]